MLFAHIYILDTLDKALLCYLSQKYFRLPSKLRNILFVLNVINAMVNIETDIVKRYIVSTYFIHWTQTKITTFGFNGLMKLV